MTSGQDPNQVAINTAKELRDDLEEIATSDLPFAFDARNILEELDQVQDGDIDVEQGDE